MRLEDHETCLRTLNPPQTHLLQPHPIYPPIDLYIHRTTTSERLSFCLNQRTKTTYLSRFTCGLHSILLHHARHCCRFNLSALSGGLRISLPLQYTHLECLLIRKTDLISIAYIVNGMSSASLLSPSIIAPAFSLPHALFDLRLILPSASGRKA